MNEKSKQWSGTKYQGIRKNNRTGKYQAYKEVNSKRKYETFVKLQDAINWRRLFNGEESELYLKSEKFHDGFKNGRLDTTLKQEWEGYSAHQEKRLEYSSFETFKDISNRLDDQLLSTPMCDLNIEHISGFIERSIPKASAKRLSFDKELKQLKAFFNFIRNTKDPSFFNPVTKYHYDLGRIKSKSSRKEKRSLTEEEFVRFLEVLPKQFKLLATVQFLVAGRIAEVVGLRKDCINFNTGEVLISRVAVFDKQSKKFRELKNCTKNGDSRLGYLSSESTLQQLSEVEVNSDGFLFHVKGEVVSYRKVQYQYNKALKRIGLYGKVSGTHFIRHTAATTTRKYHTLDHTQAVTGHKSIKLAEHYGRLNRDEKGFEVSRTLSSIVDRSA